MVYWGQSRICCQVRYREGLVAFWAWEIFEKVGPCGSSNLSYWKLWWGFAGCGSGAPDAIYHGSVGCAPNWLDLETAHSCDVPREYLYREGLKNDVGFKESKKGRASNYLMGSRSWSHGTTGGWQLQRSVLISPGCIRLLEGPDAQAWYTYAMMPSVRASSNSTLSGGLGGGSTFEWDLGSAKHQPSHLATSKVSMVKLLRPNGMGSSCTEKCSIS